ncbi:unnamed protein product [Symbiodinium natans]|uniref:Uncharacterized protein n=1 Tax=Symbiodinium natans TaxID=878477 RepID=A0A812GQ63_9DINO|nr:unnamed protein product [Symbiodinium natans]
MLGQMNDEQRAQWIDQNWRSSFMSTGRLCEGTGQTSWTVDGQADISADVWSMEENCELIGTGDDMLIRVETYDDPAMPPSNVLSEPYATVFINKLKKVRDAIVDGADVRKKTMNRMKTAILVNLVPYNKTLTHRGRMLPNLLKKGMRISTDVSQVITDLDAKVGVSASGGLEGTHTPPISCSRRRFSPMSRLFSL